MASFGHVSLSIVCKNFSRHLHLSCLLNTFTHIISIYMSNPRRFSILCDMRIECCYIVKTYGENSEQENQQMSVLSNPLHSDYENFKIKHEGNKHSYFLRAKTNRLTCYKVSEDDFKMSSLDQEREEEDLANCLVMLSNKSSAFCNSGKEENKAKEMEINVTFQCKSCKKVFSSHQALGGHRASHKRVKGCSASNSDLENVDQDSIQEDCEFLTPSETTATIPPTSSTSARKMLKMHECTICRRVFSSGQALGGHKRCHWLTSNSSDNSFIPNLHDLEYGHDQQVYKTSSDHIIDLNLNVPIPQLGRDVAANHADKTKCDQRRTEAMDAQNEEKTCTKMKLRKLSELGDVKLDRWLQVGIAPFTHIC